MPGDGAVAIWDMSPRATPHRRATRARKGRHHDGRAAIRRGGTAAAVAGGMLTNRETSIHDDALLHARVLLAEDDREMRDMVAAALRLDGAEVVVARDGTELLERLGSLTAELPAVGRSGHSPFALIIADIRMPGFTGLQVLEGMRRAGWSTPMILMTAFSDRTTRARVEEQQAVLFDKPFDVDDLRTAVLHLLRPPSSAMKAAGEHAEPAEHPSDRPLAPWAVGHSSLLPPVQPWRRR
jgi:CheY-like chemotaxis protein